MDTTEPTASVMALYAAIVKAQASAKQIEKDATNQFHRYNYVSAEAMIGEAKEILAACDLAIIPVHSSIDDAPSLDASDTEADYRKNARAAATIRASWLVVHVGGASHLISCDWPVAPEKGRPIDKAVAAARTASLSYLLRDFLQIPRVEEGTGLDDHARDRHDGNDAGGSLSETAAEIDGLGRLISAQLDRIGLKGKPALRDAAVTKAAGGKQPVSVADLRALLETLKAVKIQPAA